MHVLMTSFNENYKNQKPGEFKKYGGKQTECSAVIISADGRDS